MHQFAKRHDSAGRRSQGHGGEFFRVVPALGAQYDIEPFLAIKVLADPDAIAERPHHVGDGGPVPADFTYPLIIRSDPEFRFGQFGAGPRTNL